MLAVILLPRWASGTSTVDPDEIERLFAQVEELRQTEVAPAAAVTTPTDWEYLITQYDWDVRIARAVLLAESEGNPNAVNWNDHHGVCVGSMGVLQLGCFWASHFGYAVSDLYDPAINIDIAYRIWQEQGWRPWGSYTDLRYLDFLE